MGRNNKDLAEKINASFTEAESMTQIEASNPRVIKEYCYGEGCPTDWKRSPITTKDVKTGRIAYYCVSCEERAYYALKRQ